MDTTCIILIVVLVILALLCGFLMVKRRSLALKIAGDVFTDVVNGGGHYSDTPASGVDGVDGGGQFRLSVSDPEYTNLLEGKKTVEARLDRPPFTKLNVGDPIVVVRSRPKGDTSEYPGGRYKFNAKVTKAKKYDNLAALLKGEGVAKVYPGKTAAAAANSFALYLPPGASADDPVIALAVKATGE